MTLTPWCSIGYMNRHRSVSRKLHVKRWCNARCVKSHRVVAASTGAQGSAVIAVSSEVVMKIAILGAAGKIGALAVEESVRVGHETRALARNPARIPACGGSSLLVRVAGDVVQRSSLEKVIRGADAVVCTFGAPLTLSTVTKVPDVCLRGTEAIVSVMHSVGCSRLVCMTAIGVGDSHRRGRWIFRNVIRPVLLGRIMQDREAQESVVRDSGVMWSIVRPAELTDGAPATWRIVEPGDRTPPEPSTVARATVARFLVREAVVGQVTQRAVILCDNQ